MMFEVGNDEVHSIVSKMMISREFHAGWDQPTETIVLCRVEPSSLQVLALHFAGKVAGPVDTSVRLLDTQSGGDDYRDQYWKGSDSD
jgi:translation initiation factor 3 subunit C